MQIRLSLRNLTLDSLDFLICLHREDTHSCDLTFMLFELDQERVTLGARFLQLCLEGANALADLQIFMNPFGNKGTRAIAEALRRNPSLPLKTLHLGRVDMTPVESFELEVPFVRSEENAADILTKPMSDAKQFHKLRKILMNETD